jgi:hypothetical protein
VIPVFHELTVQVGDRVIGVADLEPVADPALDGQRGVALPAVEQHHHLDHGQPDQVGRQVTRPPHQCHAGRGVARSVAEHAQRRRGDGGEGIHLCGPLHERDRGADQAESGQHLAVLGVGLDVVGGQGQGAPVAGLGLEPAVAVAEHVAQHLVRAGQLRIELEGPLGGGFGVGQGRGPRNVHIVPVHQCMSLGQRAPGGREFGIEAHRLVQEQDGPLETPRAAAGDKGAGLEEPVVGRQVCRGRPCRSRRVKLQSERVHDGPGDVVLDGEHVVQLAVEGIGPQVEPVRHAHQLGRDAEPTARAPDTPLQDVAHAQPGPDDPEVLVVPLELEG